MAKPGKENLLAALGLARRAGKLAMGRTGAKKAMHSGKAAVILLAGDISPALAREIKYLAGMEKVPVIEARVTIDEIYFSCSARAGVIAVTDENFAAKIKSLT